MTSYRVPIDNPWFLDDFLLNSLVSSDFLLISFDFLSIDDEFHMISHWFPMTRCWFPMSSYWFPVDLLWFTHDFLLLPMICRMFFNRFPMDVFLSQEKNVSFTLFVVCIRAEALHTTHPRQQKNKHAITFTLKNLSKQVGTELFRKHCDLLGIPYSIYIWMNSNGFPWFCIDFR